MSKYYPSASIEEIERRLKSNPEGIDGFWTGWLMPVKILSIRTGPRIKKNILIKPEKRFKQGSREGLKPRWESVERLCLPVESLKTQEAE